MGGRAAAHLGRGEEVVVAHVVGVAVGAHLVVVRRRSIPLTRWVTSSGRTPSLARAATRAPLHTRLNWQGR